MGKNKKYRNEKNIAKKKYGQNFLTDSELSDRILEEADIDKNTEVVEIGPGLGFLTEKLIEKSKHLTAFEIDDDLIPVLNKKFKDKDNFLLVHKDFLEINLGEYLEDRENIKVVANIPYYITSPIINRLIEFRDNISEIYLMVQKEVAERISSKEKFDPVSKVDSAFLKIVLLQDKRYASQISEEKYFKYLKKAFSNKRKSISNNLSELGFGKEKISGVLQKVGKTSLARTEEFSVQEFIDFIKILENESGE